MIVSLEDLLRFVLILPERGSWFVGLLNIVAPVVIVYGALSDMVYFSPALIIENKYFVFWSRLRTVIWWALYCLIIPDNWSLSSSDIFLDHCLCHKIKCQMSLSK